MKYKRQTQSKLSPDGEEMDKSDDDDMSLGSPKVDSTTVGGDKDSSNSEDEKDNANDNIKVKGENDEADSKSQGTITPERDLGISLEMTNKTELCNPRCVQISPGNIRQESVEECSSSVTKNELNADKTELIEASETKENIPLKETRCPPKRGKGRKNISTTARNNLTAPNVTVTSVYKTSSDVLVQDSEGSEDCVMPQALAAQPPIITRVATKSANSGTPMVSPPAPTVTPPSDKVDNSVSQGRNLSPYSYPPHGQSPQVAVVPPMGPHGGTPGAARGYSPGTTMTPLIDNANRNGSNFPQQSSNAISDSSSYSQSYAYNTQQYNAVNNGVMNNEVQYMTNSRSNNSCYPPNSQAPMSYEGNFQSRPVGNHSSNMNYGFAERTSTQASSNGYNGGNGYNPYESSQCQSPMYSNYQLNNSCQTLPDYQEQSHNSYYSSMTQTGNYQPPADSHTLNEYTMPSSANYNNCESSSYGQYDTTASPRDLQGQSSPQSNNFPGFSEIFQQTEYYQMA